MNKRYLLSLLIILAFAGCNKTAEPQEPEDDTVSFYAGFVQDQASTKVTYKEVEHSFKLAWVKGDKVGVYSTGQSNYAYKADNNAPMTSFSYDKRSERSHSMPTIHTRRMPVPIRTKYRYQYRQSSPRHTQRQLTILQNWILCGQRQKI